MKKVASVAAGLLIAQGASAFDLSTGTPDISLDISGATAVEQFLRDYLLDDLCDPTSTISYYTDQISGTAPLNFSRDFTVACTATVGGTPRLIEVRKSGDGGSGNGVAPVCEPTPSLAQDFVDGAACAAAVTPVTIVTPGGGTTIDRYDCSTTPKETGVAPNLGISDVGPTEVGVNASTACATRPAFVLPFGVMVTEKLRNALQRAQGYTVGAEDAANVPSLSHSMLTSLITGAIPQWSDIQVRSPATGALTDLVSFNAGTPEDPTLAANYADGITDTRVSLCHRVGTSGTRSQTEVVINRERCVLGAPTLTAPNPFDFAGPTTMPLNSGSSDEAECMTALNRGVDTGTLVGSGSDRGSIWGVGHNSLEKVPNGPDINENADRREYRFIKLNGNLGNYENIANGTYYHYAESTWNFTSASLNGLPLDLANVIIPALRSPTILGAAPVQREHSWGFSGPMGFANTASDTSVAPNVYDNDLPGTPLTRAGNNCQIAVLDSAAPNTFDALLSHPFDRLD